MAKQLLQGPLEEQCEFLYQLAQEKIEAGNYTGAAHALKEIVKHAPEYKDAAELLRVVKKRKAEQRNMLMISLLGAIIFVMLASSAGLPNDFWMLGAALIGLVVGFGVANLLYSFRRRLDPKH